MMHVYTLIQNESVQSFERDFRLLEFLRNGNSIVV